MAISKAQQAAVKKYNDANYDRIEVKVPKGQKAVIQAYCEAHGKSMNEFVKAAIDNALKAGND